MAMYDATSNLTSEIRYCPFTALQLQEGRHGILASDIHH